MIKVKKLLKIFPSGKKAVDGLDLHVEEGEIVGLLGPNGAGKSTTIRVLATLSGFDEGEVFVAGYNVDTDSDKVRATIGVVAQQTGVDYFLTGRENLTLQGQLYRMNKADIRARIDELTHYFELGDHLDKLVMTYSGGMRRKLDIATALIHRPKLIFLDEPTLGLDIRSRKSLWQYIEDLNRNFGLTILLTTHYLEEADKLAHRVAIINAGKIRALGTPAELKAGIRGDSIMLSVEQATAQTHQFGESLRLQPFIKDLMWEGSKLHLYVEHGAEHIAQIAKLANEQNVPLLSISLSQPTLDDVFLKYTGTSMDDTSTEDSGDEWWKQWAGKGGGGKWQKQWAGDSQAAETSENSDAAQWPQNQGQWQQQNTADVAAQSDDTASRPAQDDWQKWQKQPSPTDPVVNAVAENTTWPQNAQEHENVATPAWPDPEQQRNPAQAGETTSWPQAQEYWQGKSSQGSSQTPSHDAWPQPQTPENTSQNMPGQAATEPSQEHQPKPPSGTEQASPNWPPWDAEDNGDKSWPQQENPTKSWRK